MKILVVIANFGTKNDGYLARVLSEYRSMPYSIDLVVVSNVPKDLGKDVEVIVGLPSKNPHSLPFAHRRAFADRRDAYDLYIYTEDDILISKRNIDAVLVAAQVLPKHEMAGFFRSEQYPNGTIYYPDAHGCFRWRPDSVKSVGAYTFAQFSNEHSGCYALTRQQLADAIASGGFAVEPHEFRYGMLESAATDLFTQCGFTKLLCLSHWNDFLVPHLPNKYLGTRLGLDGPDFDRQREVLLAASRSARFTPSLLEPETKVFHGEWSKDYYELCREDLLAHFPVKTRSVLSIGCGWGETEAALVRRGVEVTALPLDAVIGACAESRGVHVVNGSLAHGLARLRGRQFDGVLISGILHLLDDPAKTIRESSDLLAENGVFVATIPAFQSLASRRHRWKYRWQFQAWRDFRKSGVRVIEKAQAKQLFHSAGLSVDRVAYAVPDRLNHRAARFGRWGAQLFASEYIFVGRQKTRLQKSNAPSDLGQNRETDHVVPALQTGGRAQ